VTAATRFVEVDGGRLYVEISGSGPAVVLVHAGVADLRMWDDLAARLAAGHTVLRYDTRGYGRSESDHVEFSNRADLIAVMDHAGVDRATLVGVSRGGQIVLDTTLEFPGRVEALVVVAGGVGGFRPSDQGDGSLWEEAERRWDARDWDWLADFETSHWCDGPGQAATRVDPSIRARVHGWILDTYRAEKEEGIPVPLEPPAAGRLGEIGCPTLVVVGGLDDPGTNEACRFLAAGVAGARLEEFPDSAHMLVLEEPERFAGLLDEFLTGVG
jgi:3-oxoadipate enol-lactonase